MAYIRSARTILAVTAVLAGLTACGAGAASSQRAASTQSPGAGQAGSSGGGAGATATGSADGSGLSAVAAGGGASSSGSSSNAPSGTSAGAGHPGATTTTVAPNHSTPVPTTPANTGPAPAVPGTYHYSQSGATDITTGTKATTPVASQGTLVVGPASGGTQGWVRAIDGSTSTATVMLFNAGGVLVQSETVPVIGGTCTFAAPLADPPWPLAVGKSFSGQANCTGQSTGTLNVSGVVTGTESVVVGGRSVGTFVIGTTLKLAGTNLVVQEVDWYAPSLRLPVKTQTVADGSFTFGKSTYTVHSSIGSVLTSTTPA